MNAPIRWVKAITGYKTARDLKGDAGIYHVTTDADAQVGTINNKADELVAVVSAANFSALKKRVAGALAALGVKTPVLTAAANPATAEIQLVSFSAIPDDGAFTLLYGTEETASLDFDSLAADVQSALRAIPGLELVTVVGDTDEGFSVTFIGVSGDVELLTEGVNTLEASSVAVTITITEETPGN